MQNVTTIDGNNQCLLQQQRRREIQVKFKQFMYLPMFWLSDWMCLWMCIYYTEFVFLIVTSFIIHDEKVEILSVSICLFSYVIFFVWCLIWQCGEACKKNNKNIQKRVICVTNSVTKFARLVSRTTIRTDIYLSVCQLDNVTSYMLII